MTIYYTKDLRLTKKKKNSRLRRFGFVMLVFGTLSIYSYTDTFDASETNNASFIPFQLIDQNNKQTPAPFNLKEDQSYENLATQIDALFTQRNKKGIFNGSILFAKNGKVVIKKTYGYSDLRTKTPLKLNTKFQLASVSKQFTAFAIILLKEKKYLNYDDPVSKYLKDFPYKKVTIRHLLTHRSGLANYNYFADKFWKNKNKPLANKDIVKMMAKNKGLYYTSPGNKFNYCNTNYVLLAAIIEKISGMAFKQFMETQVFRPLHMYNTKIFTLSDSASITNKAKGHEARGWLTKFTYQDEATGDKGVYSTPEDMFIWDQYLYSNDFISQTEIQEAFKPGGSWAGINNYGFGWRLVKTSKTKYITYHTGWWHGFRSYFIRLPEEKGTIIILNNSLRGSFFRTTDLVKLLDS